VKMMLFGNGLSWSFQSPAGKTIVPGKTNLGTGEYGDTGLGFAVLSLEHPEQGPWTLDIAAPKSDTAVSYAILIDADGAREEVAHIETMPREGDPRVSFRARPGDPVFIRTFVSRNGRPVPRARRSCGFDRVAAPGRRSGDFVHRNAAPVGRLSRCGPPSS